MREGRRRKCNRGHQGGRGRKRGSQEREDSERQKKEVLFLSFLRLLLPLRCTLLSTLFCPPTLRYGGSPILYLPWLSLPGPVL